MKNYLLSLLFVFSIFSGSAQSLDTITVIKNPDKLTIKQLIIPAALVSAGFLLKGSQINQNIQQDRRKLFGADFKNSTDDYIQYVPIAQLYLGKSLGFQPKNDFHHQTIHLIIANAIMGTTVLVMKKSFKEQRPDMSNDLSFPSGHTATGFTNATLLFYEFKDSNLWYASSGFLFATATGVLRIANNKHFASDVLAGAGIGMASGIIVSYWNPFKSMTFGKNKKTSAFVYPQIGNQIGIGAVVNLN